MQQHSGQHILSRGFIEVAGAPTMSFHMGESACTIDVRLAEPDDETIRAAEAQANAVVFGDVPVSVRSVSPDRAPRSDEELPRELALKPGDPVRIVSIGEFDETPCGGTHVRRSGEIGAVAIRGWERFKGGTRITFACGGRAVRMLAELASSVDACVERLSAPPPELPSAIDRLQAQLGEARRELKRLAGALAAAEAEARLASARSIGGCRAVIAVLDDRGAEEIALLARSCASRPGAIALLAAGRPGSDKTFLVFARSEEGAAGPLDMGQLLAAVCKPRGGKGGGGPTFARGGGVPTERLREALEEACGLIAERLSPPR
jgi:alanyl-tRNA synthetase